MSQIIYTFLDCLVFIKQISWLNPLYGDITSYLHITRILTLRENDLWNHQPVYKNCKDQQKLPIPILQKEWWVIWGNKTEIQ